MPDSLLQHDLPLWPNIVSTGFVLLLIPAYWRYYGPANFLWFSDIALFGAVLALWLQSPLIASMMLLCAFLPELGWNIDFLAGLLTGKSPLNYTAYMFNARIPKFIRAISLFHIPLPLTLIWLVRRLGYDRRALIVQTLLCWVVLIATRLLTNPATNINYAFTPLFGLQGRTGFLARMLAMPILLYLPVHLGIIFILRYVA